MPDMGTTVGLIQAMAGAEVQELKSAIAQIQEDIPGAVADWLDDHPEATTTVQDGSITDAKLAKSVKDKVNSVLAFGKINFLNYSSAFSKKANSYRLNESDGYCSSDSDYCLLKYPVTAGTTIRVVSDDRFQFQTTYTTNMSGANYKVGDVYGSGDYAVIVPDTATWLVVSTTKTNSNSAVYLANIGDNKVNKYPETITTGKYINYNNGNESSLTGVNYVTLNVIEGYKLQYDYVVDTADSRGVVFYDASGGKISGVQTGTTAQEITVPAGAVLCKATVTAPYQIYIKSVIDTIIKDLRNVQRQSANPLATIKETISFLRCFLHVGCIGDSLASG